MALLISVQIIQGNVNTYMTELREIDPPLIARRVRFVPYSAHPKHICMRVELYGCPWTGEKWIVGTHKRWLMNMLDKCRGF